MSGAVLEGEPSTRRESDRQKPAAAAGPVIEIVDDQQQHSGPSIEEALAASRRATEQAEAAQQAALNRERQANAELQRLQQSQVQDQAAVLASAVEASTAERDRHAHAWQAAMEAGDFPAAAKHQSDMMMATAKLERAGGELAMMKAGQGHQQQPRQPQQQQQSGVSEASQEWIDSHPEFNRYAKQLIAKSNELIRAGVRVDGPKYFRELDAEYDRLMGDSGGQRDVSQNRDRQFDGAPPSRTGGNGAGDNTGRGSGTVQTMLGPVGVRVSNGQTYLNIPAHLREDFAEGAKVTGLSIEEYAMEQVTIARDREAGRTGGLITAEGARFK
jgi:hypothetical protein